MSKKVYEHLLSQDPIGAFEKIKQDLIRYFSYVYRVNNDELNKERIRRLGEEDNLYKEPYLEILPEYKSVENINGIEDLWKEFVAAFGDEKISKQFFSDFIKQGLMNYTPYVHQKEMLEKAFIQKNNVVITSGTGSGKTESFLLPLLAQLFSEAKTWPKPNYDSIDWFKGKKKEGKKYEPCQRKGETRKSAMRALVLYPMNALVEDQMTRLRRALDNDAIRTFFDSEEGLKGNRIYFGRYTRNSIGSKSHALIKQYKPKQLNDKEKDVAKKLSEIHHKYVNILKHYNSDKEKEDDASLFVTPRLDDQSRTAEMLTRWDMQIAPPDIMITNTSMLSIMLMRTAEEDIFKSTREWLNADDI